MGVIDGHVSVGTRAVDELKYSGGREKWKRPDAKEVFIPRIEIGR